MAVYKPTDIQPSLVTFDKTKNLPIWFSCKVDTNNVNVSSYSIKLLDENNNIIFNANRNQTSISDLKTFCDSNYRNYVSKYGRNVNTGVNGSYIVIPFITNNLATNSVVNNQIRYDNSILSNNKTYKWTITMYQGTFQGQSLNTTPLNIKYYDMLIANGTVIGSTNNRIQSIKSNKIYSDYFVQPVYIDGIGENDFDNWFSAGTTPEVTQIGARQLIESYDSTFGHIYPVKNKLSLNFNTKRANGFQIFKMSNDPENLTQYQKVDLLLNKYLPMEKWVDQPVSGTSYYEYSYVSSTAPQDQTFQQQGIDFKVGQRVILNKQNNGQQFKSGRYYNLGMFVYRPLSNPNDVKYWFRSLVANNNNPLPTNNVSDNNWEYLSNGSGDEYVVRNNITYSNHNGIFRPEITVEDRGDTVSPEWRYKITVRWYRTSDADTWGEISQKIVRVEEEIDSYGQRIYSGRNVQLYPEVDYGTLDRYPVINSDLLAFSNEKPVDIYEYNQNMYDNELVNNTGLILYTNENWLFIRPSEAVYNNMKIFFDDGNYYDIDFQNQRNIGFKEYGGINLPQNYVVDQTKYQIKSYFRESNESVFTINSDPNISISLYDKEGNEYTSLNNIGAIIITNWNFIAKGNYDQSDLIQWKSFQWKLYSYNGIEIFDSDVNYDGLIETEIYGIVSDHEYTLKLVIETNDGRFFSNEVKIYAQFEYEYIGPDSAIIDVNFDCESTSTSIVANENSPVYGEADGDASVSEEEELLTLGDSGSVKYKKLYNEGMAIEGSSISSYNNDEIFTLQGSFQINSSKFLGDFFEVNDDDSNSVILKSYLSPIVVKDKNGDIILSNTHGRVVVESNSNSITGHLGDDYNPDNYITVSIWQKSDASISEYDLTNFIDISFAQTFETDDNGKKYKNIRDIYNKFGTVNILQPFVDIKNTSYTGITNSPIMVSENAEDVTGDKIRIVGSSAIIDSDYKMASKLVIVGRSSSEGYSQEWKNVITKDINYDNDVDNGNIVFDIDGEFVTNGSTERSIGKVLLNGEVKEEKTIGTLTTATYSNINLQKQEKVNDGETLQPEIVDYGSKVVVFDIKFAKNKDSEGFHIIPNKSSITFSEPESDEVGE